MFHFKYLLILLFVTIAYNTKANNTCDGFSVDINVFGNTNLCTGDSVVLQANNGTSFSWTNGAISQSIVVYETGTFSVTVQDNNNCVAISNSISVSEINEFEGEIILNGDSIICPGETVIITSSISENFEWNTGDLNQSIITDQEGTYILTVSDDNNCEIDIDSVSLVAQTAQNPQIITNDPLIFCTGNSANLYLDLPSNYTFAWNSGEIDTIINVSESGMYYAIANDPVSGCTVYSDTVEVQVGIPVSPEITVTGDSILCEGDSIILNSSDAFSYFWTDGQTTQEIVVKDTGGYFNVTTFDYFGCQAISDSVLLIYEPDLPTPEIFGDSLIIAGDQYQYFVNAPDNYTIEWNIYGGELNISNEDSIIVIWSADDDNKYLCVDIWSEYSCTYNSNCLGIKFYTDLNDFDLLNSALKFFPNPADNKIEIIISDEIVLDKIGIYNYYGELLFEQKNNSVINVSQFNSGVYLIKAETNNGILYKEIQVIH